MTPRQVDVAYVLEGVVGLITVHAVEPLARRATPEDQVEIAVRAPLEHWAAAHYALLRVLTHEECRKVLFYELDLPTGMEQRATRLVLSAADRETARLRVPQTTEALQQVAPIALSRRGPLSVLVVDSDDDVRWTVTVFLVSANPLGSFSRPQVIEDPRAACTIAMHSNFDAHLCDARLAFGQDGFLRLLHDADPVRARRVIVTGSPAEKELALSNIRELAPDGPAAVNTFLSKPFDREDLSNAIGMDPWERPPWLVALIRPRRLETAPAQVKPHAQRVLVVDDDPGTARSLATMGGGHIEVTVTANEWEAIDRVEEGAIDLLLCSVALKTAGGKPFYRFLWTASPDLKRRFVFITDATGAPPSAREGAVVVRPITPETVLSLLKRG